ncbi:class III poly(R)-hydroxyalkanoic acid synthase subunit PhaC [Pelagicoccus mobilis]|uniref:Poly(3-hydroxyalkanoate) polymerase subunit PhaC n=1 Tax=Pelagicoccus mobilis TaxID=415221 RepID=A0A934VR36_9BACT|nr:class III poly(R)-hydroxyalkanoic acid synthase subunit PhaC [Pelagicoccus mobilis]MBK1877535.1 class III poly(R)-hydroxyalkanoic acid synthase subunit PhaC [Pelagicoccus mobilis]
MVSSSDQEFDVLAWQKSLVEESFANMRRMAALPFLHEKAQKVRKGVTPKEVVYEEDKLKVYRYIGKGPIKHKTPLVIVFALVNRPYIVDLKEGRSVVANFVDAGFDTYLIDWGRPNQSDRFLTTDDYVNGYIKNCIDYVNERCGTKQANVLGYCMGGTLSTMFTALHQDVVKNLILLATGIDFATREGLINLWADEKHFDVDAFVDTVGNVPAEFLQQAFLMLKPVQNLIEKPLSFWENIENDRFVDDFLHMETWLNDNIAVPGEVYREFAKYLFQKNLLTQNKFPVGKHIVDLRKITCPVLNLMATNDDLVPPAQSEPLNKLISSKDEKIIKFKAGHIGLAVGGKAQKQLWPEVVDWLAERD